MAANRKATLEELEWKDVRGEVFSKNPELASIIDEISPSSEYTLFKASYPFGSEILKNGSLYVPNKEGFLKIITSDEIPKNVREKLSYNLNSNPVTLALHNTTEIFIVHENSTIPFYGLLTPGRIFGTWRILNPQIAQHPVFIWDMTAGARSIFMLPKISEAAGYNKLRRAFHIQTEKPTSLLDHWKLFKELANHSAFNENWEARLLFFSNKWFERLNDKQWSGFKLYLLEKAWEGSEFFRNQFIWDLVFSLIRWQRHIKPNPYFADVVKHQIAIGIGALPGFAPALDNVVAPIHKLQEIFTTVYQLENYVPVIMQPYFFSLENPRPIYYSLQYPAMAEFAPRSREISTKLNDIYEIQQLLKKYLVDIYSGKLNVNGTLIYNLYEKVQYDFFHTNAEKHTGIRSSKDVPIEDPAFLQAAIGTNNNFPANSPFIRGCIRISAKAK